VPPAPTGSHGLNPRPHAPDFPECFRVLKTFYAGDPRVRPRLSYLLFTWKNELLGSWHSSGPSPSILRPYVFPAQYPVVLRAGCYCSISFSASSNAAGPTRTSPSKAWSSTPTVNTRRTTTTVSAPVATACSLKLRIAKR
jgi:hypothetical protein